MTKKISLLIIAMYLNLALVFSQTANIPDTADYKKRKLTIEEVNLVSGYYQQDGNHSGVTAGIGTEKLTDVANTIDLKLTKATLSGNKHTLYFEFGVDTYTSASSDNIGPLSGPSRTDTRIYPSLSYKKEFESKKMAVGGGISYSNEFDYESRGLNFSFSKWDKNRNRQIDLMLYAYLDSWKVIYPEELRPAGYGNEITGEPIDGDREPRNSFQASVIYSQTINPRMQLALLVDPAYQAGQLSTLYQRVQFSDHTVSPEKLPSTRFKLPAGIRVHYFWGNHLVVRGYYRFYIDSWGNVANTFSVELPVKTGAFFSIIPFYRFSQQSGIDYFAPFEQNDPGAKYYTSDYDLSAFNSHLTGLGLRWSPPKGVFKIKHFSALELRYSHYMRSTDLVGNSLTAALKFK